MNNSVRTHILHELDDLIQGGVAGDPLVDVGDNIHADVAEEVLGLLGLVTRHQGGEEEEEGRGQPQHHGGGLSVWEIMETLQSACSLSFEPVSVDVREYEEMG